MQPNLDLVRSLFAAWERSDFSSAEWADPEIEFVVAGGPSPGSYTGLTSMARRLRDFLSAWEEYRIEAEEYREVDRERVVVLTRDSGRGKTSELEIRQIRAYLFCIRGGRVTRLVLYWDRAEALAELGLAPETG
jgi:ketosteroid isomerase-like protein